MKGCTPLAWPCSGQLISNNPLSAFPADLPFPLPFFISCLFMSFLTRYRNSEPSLDTSAATIPRCRCHSYRKIKPLSFMVASLDYLQPCRHFDRRGVGSQSPFTFFGFEKHTMKPSPTSWCSSTRKTSPYYFAKGPVYGLTVAADSE